MTGDYHEDFSVFQRTKLEYLTDSYDNAQAADFCWEQFKVHRSVLMVVNTRKTAADLYRRLKERVEDGEENVHLIHLSTNMCPAHRENAIREMRKYLGSLRNVGVVKSICKQVQTAAYQGSNHGISATGGFISHGYSFFRNRVSFVN